MLAGKTKYLGTLHKQEIFIFDKQYYMTYSISKEIILYGTKYKA